MPNDSCLFKFDVRISRTTNETFRLNTMVARHGVKELRNIRENSPFHFANPTPFDVGWVILQLITGSFTTVTAHTNIGIKVKTVLFSLF
jgi:hypothetical protein